VNASWFPKMILFGGVVILNYVLAVKLVGIEPHEKLIVDRFKWRFVPKSER
jgi:hypothetical protein